MDKKELLEELKRRKSKQFVLSKYLFDKQLEFVTNPSPFKVAVTSRRSGKTVSCAADLIDTCLKHPDVVCLYITLSRAVAKRNIWPEIKRICKKFDIDASFNEADLSATFANDSIIYVSGANDKSEIEKFRGLAVKKVYIDECQSFPSFIEELIDDVLAPSLMDYAGTLALIGTPGPVPAGYFYDTFVKENDYTKYKWTYFDNPHISRKSGMSHKALLKRELKRRGVSESDPKVRREWFGEWVLDLNSLVFKYDSNNNSYDSLPVLDNFIIGVDIGYEDADALAVIGWNDKDKITYLVEERITRHQGLTELVAQIEELRKRYDCSKIVMDTAGLGKKIAEEITRRYKITIIPAEKPRKLEYIELLNDAMATGVFKAQPNSKFAQDCFKVEWDFDRSTPDKRKIATNYHSDICDAVLYAFRESYAYTHDALAKPAPKYGTPEFWQAEEERMQEEAQAFFEAQEAAIKNDPYSS